MAPEQVREAERLLLGGASLDAVCEAVGVTRRTLERAFKAAHGERVGPARWLRLQRGDAGGGSAPLVSFRFERAEELADAARAARCSSAEWARRAVLAALDGRR